MYNGLQSNSPFRKNYRMTYLEQRRENILGKKVEKKKTITQLDGILWKVFSEYIRLRDSDDKGFCKCFTCPNIRFWNKGDCGHGIPRQYKSTKFNERNNHFQCKHCNGFEGGK